MRVVVQQITLREGAMPKHDEFYEKNGEAKERDADDTRNPDLAERDPDDQPEALLRQSDHHAKNADRDHGDRTPDPSEDLRDHAHRE
jgi:hypothetical protein